MRAFTANSRAVGRACLFTIYLAGSLCFGQVTKPLVPGTVVTGKCEGHGSDPGCVLPNLFGSTGLTVFANPVVPHYAHFIGAAQTTLNQTLSSAIATQLAILPIISPSSGFTYKYSSEAGAFVRSTTSFGPIYAERAETIGKGVTAFGISYQRFRFSSIDGVDLHNIPAVFSHIDNTGPGGAPETYEADVIQTTNNVNLNIDSTTLYGTVGITDRLDVSISVPMVSVRMSVNSGASIVRVSGPTFTLPSGVILPNPHQFTADPNSLSLPPTGSRLKKYSSCSMASSVKTMIGFTSRGASVLGSASLGAVVIQSWYSPRRFQTASSSGGVTVLKSKCR